MYDRIVGNQSIFPDWAPTGTDEFDAYFADVKETVLSAVVIVADNVVEHYFEGTGQEHWDLTRDYPTIAPPFERFWIEAYAPSKIVSDQKGVSPFRLCRAFGMAVKADPWAPRSRHDPRRWLIQTTMYIEQLNGLIVGPFASSHFALDAAGKVVEAGDATYRIFTPVCEDVPAEKCDWIRQVMTSLELPLWLAVSFMHCKNVEVTEVVPPRPKQAARRARLRPRVRYHTIDIDPMRKVLRTEGKSDEVGLRKALHICRGHFATYTPEKPLFGRVVGTFWKPLHVRGSMSEGRVESGYRVKPDTREGS
jgi:hypothetical protein